MKRAAEEEDDGRKGNGREKEGGGKELTIFPSLFLNFTSTHVPRNPLAYG
jgi:hypothetical protein